MTHARLRLTTLFLGFCLAGSACALRADPGDPTSFRIHWGVAGGALSAAIDLGEAPLRRDTVIFYEHLFGNFPREGPHLIELAPDGPSGYLDRHLNRVRADVKARIPDPAFDGLAVIDYESWWPYWGAASGPMQQWRDYIDTHRPHLISGKSSKEAELVYRDTWEEAVRPFWEQTLLECQQLRPHATWGFYGLPQRSYWAWVQDSPHRLEQRAELQDWHDRIEWLFDAVDAHFPSLYIFYESASDPVSGQLQTRPENNERYLRRNITEALRVGKGKPVIPFVWYMYHSNGMGPTNWRGFVNDLDLDKMFALPRDEGLPGVVLWGWVRNPQEQNELQDFVDQRLIPVVQQHAFEPPDPPDPGTGSNGDPPDPGTGGDPPDPGTGNGDGSNNTPGGTNTGGNDRLPHTPGSGSNNTGGDGSNTDGSGVNTTTGGGGNTSGGNTGGNTTGPSNDPPPPSGGGSNVNTTAGSGQSDTGGTTGSGAGTTGGEGAGTVGGESGTAGEPGTGTSTRAARRGGRGGGGGGGGGGGSALSGGGTAGSVSGGGVGGVQTITSTGGERRVVVTFTREEIQEAIRRARSSVLRPPVQAKGSDD